MSEEAFGLVWAEDGLYAADGTKLAEEYRFTTEELSELAQKLADAIDRDCEEAIMKAYHE